MIVLLLALAFEPSKRVVEVPPRPVEWRALGEQGFAPSWRLPSALEDPRAAFATVRALAEARWTVRESGEEWALGDLVVRHDELEPAARGAWRAALPERLEGLTGADHSYLVALLADEVLHGSDWTSATDHGADGLLVFDEWTLRPPRGDAWRELSDELRFAQVAALVRSDVATLRAVDNDYRTYYDHVGADYEAIHPVEDSHLRGRHEDGRPFSSHALYFRCDLPFPFTDYESRLGILNWVCERGLLRTDIYSASDDFHYFAGRDVLFPVATAAGDPVGLLVVRQFGFDLSGVPDGADQRAEAARGSLGNLKRKAERAARGSEFDASPEAHTRYRVIGLR